ncbi:MAG: phosphate signaling complex protein PhoU [Gammaproteobacteria bacterium]|nr:phosphate signaling complex protein PhoU [Gammaproteobacteria bacterium]MDH5239506.1 phosphate signaling complex protein PhoU [Gammaproteobacteria bacterium]MDH5260148.1 phosphate signaling complex protein PhoU [Gammaproteobacteria bacterium]MDH5583671.1 phosphate signaling complex protein PhoU [Gammaproteobacteria bacterium]
MEASDLSGHISRRFNKDIEGLRNMVLSMGGLVESQLTHAIAALVTGDSELGLKVANDDYKVNDLEVSIDEECGRILAMRAPAAGDLRLIVAVIKTITDLERIGDEAEKIGFLASKLAAMDRPSDSYRELKTLGTHVAHMVRDAMNAFARLDVDEAFKVVREDKEVDREYEAIQRQCITFMMEDPREIKRVMNVTWAARSLERIGDHAKNICEYVIYMAQGRDVRHTGISDSSDISSD